MCRDCLSDPKPFEAEYFCVSCRTPFLNSFPLDFEGRCPICRSGLRGFDSAHCYGTYEGVLRELIHLFKYARIKTLARPLGDFMAAAFPREESFDAITPVPLHWRRQWQRGFNQSDLLARDLSRRCGIPVLRALRRRAATDAQAGLSNTARRRNVTGAFRARGDVEGKRILLVDDVMTTGSTAAACALALKSRGAVRVALLTLARVDRRIGKPRTAVAAASAKRGTALR